MTQLLLVLLFVDISHALFGFYGETNCSDFIDTGNCSYKVPRYAFAPSMRDCVTFDYSGCGGNTNNFLTYNHCIESCLREKAKTFEHEAEIGGHGVNEGSNQYPDNGTDKGHEVTLDVTDRTERVQSVNDVKESEDDKAFSESIEGEAGDRIEEVKEEEERDDMSTTVRFVVTKDKGMTTFASTTATPG